MIIAEQIQLSDDIIQGSEKFEDTENRNGEEAYENNGSNEEELKQAIANPQTKLDWNSLVSKLVYFKRQKRELYNTVLLEIP